LRSETALEFLMDRQSRSLLPIANITIYDSRFTFNQYWVDKEDQVVFVC